MSIDQFRARFEAEGGDPEVVIALLIEAIVTLETDESLGTEMVETVISKRLDAREYIRRLRANKNIARSYAGGTYQNDYNDFQATAPDVALDREYSSAGQGIGFPSEGRAKFFVVCGGADRPRPIMLAKNNSGLWKVTEFSSLTVGVRQPASVAGDF